MSNAKKIRKPILSDRAKENLRLGFSTLFNNEAVVNMAHTRPWYSAAIVGALSLILTVIPTFVSQIQVKGGSILDAPSYSYDMGLVHFQEDVQEYEADVASRKIFGYDETSETLEVSQSNWNAFLVQYSSVKDYYYYHNENVSFKVYYKNLDKADLCTFATNIYKEDNPSSSVCTGVNELILGNENFYIYKYNATPALNAGSYTIDWVYKSALPIYEAKAPVKKASESDQDYADALDAYRKTTVTNWQEFLNKAYEGYKVRMAWTQTGIMFGIYGGFILLMGVMFFLMSRGKNNVARIYTFWECMKMAFWGADSPAILAMAFGFWLSGSIFTYAFIFLFGIRAVWLSMKYMRPAVQK